MYFWQKNRIHFRLKLLKKFFHIMKVRPVHIITPVVFSFILAALEGVSLGLLIPLCRGMVSNFDFIQTIPVLKYLYPIASHFGSVYFNRNKIIFLILTILIISIVILKSAFYYVNHILSNLWNGKFKVNTYRFVFDRFMRFGKLYFDRSNQGAIALILSYSNSFISLLGLFVDSVNSFFMLLVYLWLMFSISWQLSLVSILVFPILQLSLKVILQKLRVLAELSNQSTIELSKKVFNILACIPLIKAYSKETKISNEYNGLNDYLRTLELKKARVEGLIYPLMEIITTGFILLMAAIVALVLAKDDPAKISIFVVFFYAARKSLPLFNIFNQIAQKLNNLKPPLRQLVETLDDEDKFFVEEGSREFNGLNKSIDFIDLNFSYLKNVEVLKGVSVSIEAGKITAIVGPTGSGKTTLISLIMRFYDCPKGAILLDGEDVREFTVKSVRRHIALVSQETLLFNDSIRNNLSFGLDREVSDDELIVVAKKARIYDLIASLPDGIDTEVGDRGIKLSGGEKQRVAIARALLKGSSILILDEATSSLDSKTESLIQDAVDSAIQNKTAIIIAHRLSTIKNADKIVVVEGGRVVEEGGLVELLEKKGKFYGYWQAQKFS